MAAKARKTDILICDTAGRLHNKQNLIEKYRQVTENEIRVEVDGIEDADLVISAYGTTARIAKSAIEHLRKEGHKVGLIRPITCWPYPYEAFKGINPNCKDILVCEMNQGQMTDDVKIAVEGRQKVHFFGRQGGVRIDCNITEIIRNII